MGILEGEESTAKTNLTTFFRDQSFEFHKLTTLDFNFYHNLAFSSQHNDITKIGDIEEQTGWQLDVIFALTLQWNIMNIAKNSQNITPEDKSGIFNVLGDNNSIHLTRSPITIIGNKNILLIHNSRTTVHLIGNQNTVSTANQILSYGFNGNLNQLHVDLRSYHHLEYCDGTDSLYPGLVNNGEIHRQQTQQRNSSANRRRDILQNNYFQLSQQQRTGNFSSYNDYNQRIISHLLNNLHMRISSSIDSMRQQSHGVYAMLPSHRQHIGTSRPIRNNHYSPVNLDPKDNQYIIEQTHLRVRAALMFQRVEPNQEQQKGLNSHQLDMLPRSRHQGKDGKCIICLAEINMGDDETFLMCFHSFHTNCVGNWLKQSEKCPICKLDVKAHLK